MLSADAHAEGNCFEFEALNSTFKHITDVLQKIGSSSGCSLPEESVGNITSWKFLFELFVADLRLDLLCDKLTIFFKVSCLLHSLIYCLPCSAFKFAIW